MNTLDENKFIMDGTIIELINTVNELKSEVDRLKIELEEIKNGECKI